MRRFMRFERTGNRWYAVVPEWTGSQDDLEMISGADTMLEMLGGGESEVFILMGTLPLELDMKPTLVKKHDTPEIGGAQYEFRSWNGTDFNYEVWLCDVTKFVFGYLPDEIYLQ